MPAKYSRAGSSGATAAARSSMIRGSSPQIRSANRPPDSSGSRSRSFHGLTSSFHSDDRVMRNCGRRQVAAAQRDEAVDRHQLPHPLAVDFGNDLRVGLPADLPHRVDDDREPLAGVHRLGGREVRGGGAHAGIVRGGECRRAQAVPSEALHPAAPIRRRLDPGDVDARVLQVHHDRLAPLVGADVAGLVLGLGPDQELVRPVTAHRPDLHAGPVQPAGQARPAGSASSRRRPAGCRPP